MNALRSTGFMQPAKMIGIVLRIDIFQAREEPDGYSKTFVRDISFYPLCDTHLTCTQRQGDMFTMILDATVSFIDKLLEVY